MSCQSDVSKMPCLGLLHGRQSWAVQSQTRAAAAWVAHFSPVGKEVEESVAYISQLFQWVAGRASLLYPALSPRRSKFVRGLEFCQVLKVPQDLGKAIEISLTHPDTQSWFDVQRENHPKRVPLPWCPICFGKSTAKPWRKFQKFYRMFGNPWLDTYQSSICCPKSCLVITYPLV